MIALVPILETMRALYKSHLGAPRGATVMGDASSTCHWSSQIRHSELRAALSSESRLFKCALTAAAFDSPSILVCLSEQVSKDHQLSGSFHIHDCSVLNPFSVMD